MMRVHPVIVLILVCFPLLYADQFEVDGEIISDTHTGLQWRCGSDIDTNWNEAFQWVNSLGDGWRMPSRTELRALYDSGVYIRTWGSFDNSGFVVTIWSGEASVTKAWSMSFFRGPGGGNEYWHFHRVSLDRRVLAVRPGYSSNDVSIPSSSSSAVIVTSEQSFDPVNTIRPEVVSFLGNAARTRVLQDSDLTQLSYREIKLVRNYFYACYDRPFATTWIREFFSQNMSAYRGNGVSSPVLTDTENSNISIIQEYERTNNIPVIDY